jgi:hypothetical protein
MKIRIIAQGIGGEFVVGTVPKKTGDYWEERGMEDLEEHLNENLDLDDVPEEHELSPWFDIDNIKHGNNIFMDGPPCLHIENAETDEEIAEITLDDKFLKDKTTHDGSMKTDRILQRIDKEDCLFFAQSVEKGTWILDDFEIDHEFDAEKLSLTTTECDGAVYLSTINYAGEDASDLSVVNGDTRRVSFNFFFHFND